MSTEPSRLPADRAMGRAPPHPCRMILEIPAWPILDAVDPRDRLRLAGKRTATSWNASARSMPTPSARTTPRCIAVITDGGTAPCWQTSPHQDNTLAAFWPALVIPGDAVSCQSSKGKRRKHSRGVPYDKKR